MNEPIRQAVPKPSPQLQQIRAALKVAEDRLHWLVGHCPTNALAMRAQTKIITQYERQIAELESTEEDWLA